MVESDHSLRMKTRLSSSSVLETTTSRNLMARKLQNQSNRSVRAASAVSHSGKRFLTDLRHHDASYIAGKIDTKVISRARPLVTMKNLCLRRVFSPSPISTNWDFDVKGENRIKKLDVESPSKPSNSNATGDDQEAVELSETTLTESEMFTGELTLVKNEAGSISQEINEVTGKKVGSSLCSKEIRYPEKIFKNLGSVSYRRLLPYLMEAADVDLNDPKNKRGELMAAKDRVPETESVSRSANSFVKPSSSQSLNGNISPSKKMASSNATKVSLNSRRKLFKVPGSVNYRRMLSYLNENPEDNPGTPETSTHITPQKNIEENALATENKGVSNEARDSKSCPTSFEAPLSNLENEQKTRLKCAEIVSSVAVSVI